jgi:hypothetical protein
VTSAAGVFTVTATAADVAGHAATATATYRVGCRHEDEGDREHDRGGSDRRKKNAAAHRQRPVGCEDEHRHVERGHARD